MATTQNSRSEYLALANPRLLSSANAALILSASSPVFHVDTAGNPDTTGITFTAIAVQMGAGLTYNFSCIGGTLTGVSGNTATLTYANMSANDATISVSVTYRGVTYPASTKVSKLFDVAQGTQGLNNAIVYAYQRSASVLSSNPGTVSYDFVAASITTATLANGWSKTIPAGTSPLYVTAASASSANPTDTIAANEWSTPVVMAQNGADGSTGLNSATVTIYQRTATNVAPALPSASTTYTFSPAGITGLTNGWTFNIPVAGANAYLWATTATAVSTSGTDTIPSTEWAAAQLVAQDGTKGDPGNNGTSPNKNGVAYLYKWATATPAKPTNNSTFTWASAANTAYSGADGWTITVPSNPGTPLAQLYVASIAVTDVAGATSTSVSYASSTVAAWSQNGSNGSNGVTGVQSGEAKVYQWAATIPTGPIGSPTFTWATGLFGLAPAGWNLTPGTAASPGMTLWMARVGLTDSAANATTSFNWSAASIVATGGSGTNGSNGTAMYVEISTSGGQVYSRATSAAAFAPTSITLTATPYGGAASAYQWQYWTGSAWTNLAGATTATYAVASGSFTGSRVFRVQATIAGTVYTDEMTLVQVTGGTNGANGIDAVVGFLTNESVTVAATSAGTVSGGFSTAGGTFKIYDGITDKTGDAAVVYSVFAETGVDVSIAATGVYTVVSMSADTGSATLRAVYNGITIDRTYSIAKAKAGTSITGAEGVSYVTAYCASATASTTTAPTATAGKTSVPAVNGGGITGTWTKTVPALTSGQFMYQSDGLYNPANDTVTWSIPYWSALKVGSLSAITANLGAITGGSMDIGTGSTSWHVNSTGDMWIGAGTFNAAPFRVSNLGAATATSLTIQKPDGTPVLTMGGLQPGFEAPGTKNSDLQPAIDAATSRIALISRDDILDRSEKPKIILERRTIVEEFDGLYLQAQSLGLIAERDAYAAPFDLLLAYLDTQLNPTLTDLSQDTQITRSVFNSRFADYYKAKETLGVAVRAKTATMAQWAGVGGTGKPADNATVGAPAGTNVAGVSAATVVSNAAAGKSANDALPGINADIATKLSRTSASSLAATITVSTGGSILAGTTTNGTYMSPSGFYGVQGGVVKFSVPISGDPTFGGTLTAPSGSLGSLTIDPAGFIRQGMPSYYSGTGFWLGNHAGVTKLSIGQAGVSGLYWNGSKLVIEGPDISGANFGNARTASISSNPGVNFAHGKFSVNTPCGTHTASITSAVSPTYSWSITSSAVQATFSLSSTTSAATTVYVTAKGAVAGDNVDCIITCTISDGGVTKSTSQVISVEFL